MSWWQFLLVPREEAFAAKVISSSAEIHEWMTVQETSVWYGEYGSHGSDGHSDPPLDHSSFLQRLKRSAAALRVPTRAQLIENARRVSCKHIDARYVSSLCPVLAQPAARLVDVTSQRLEGRQTHGTQLET